jgi:hypothetical protein
MVGDKGRFRFAEITLIAHHIIRKKVHNILDLDIQNFGKNYLDISKCRLPSGIHSTYQNFKISSVAKLKNMSKTGCTGPRSC